MGGNTTLSLIRLTPVISEKGVTFVPSTNSKTSYQTNASSVIDFFDVPVFGVANSGVVAR